MDWADVVFPGRAAMRAQVHRRYAGGSALDSLEYRFGYWIAHGDGTPEAVRRPVEGAVAGCFARAAAIGKWWGIALGAAAGLGLWACAAAVTLLLQAVA